MSVCIYYGGTGTYDEKIEILEWLKSLDDRKYTVLTCEFSNRKNDPPIPVFIFKDNT